MEKPFNLKVVETKEQILKLISESQLPAVVTQMLLREINNAVDLQVKTIIDNERKEYEKGGE